MVRRFYPYGVAVVAVAVVAMALGTLAWALSIPRIETFLLIFVLLTGAIAWVYGRGPAVVAAVAVVIAVDYFFIPPNPGFTVGTLSDLIRLVTGVLAAGAVIQFVHISRRGQGLMEKRKDLLQEVSPRIIQSLDAEEILATVTEATLRVIDYQHFRFYRWDESTGRLVLVKSVARAEPYGGIDWHSITLGLGEGITGIVGQTRRSILVRDATEDSRMVYPQGTSPIQESVLSVPMVTQDRLFGVLSLARLGADSLTVEDLRLMESIAAQTALALANAEQYAEAQQTIQALTTIEALQPGAVPLPDGEADQRIVEGLVALSRCDLASLRLVQLDGLYHLRATGGPFRPQHPAVTDEPLSENQVAWLADPRITAYVADSQTDSRLPEWVRRSATGTGMLRSVFLPMRAGQRFLGFIGLHWGRARWLRPEQLSRFQLVAAQAAILVEAREALQRERDRADALIELEKARREFMQIASHELRTPLTVIRGYASLLEEGSLGPMPSAAQHALHTLMAKSTEMRAQVERMLLLARLEDGAAPPQMTRLDLRKLVNDAVERVRPQIELKQGDLRLDLSPAPLTVVGDPERLASAVDNLLQNAVKFSPETPHIEVVGEREDGHVRLLVKDHGIGIPREAQSRLFEKFYRVNDPRLQNVSGTGIGLYLVRQVVEGHGGQVAVESQPGEGTAFRIDLPSATNGDGGQGARPA
jgi:signal transduction histidine kinase/putative methionine-R-sulfoxide reductase with GAF domain